MEERPAPSRRASPDDAPALANLVDFAGEGLPSHLWAQMVEPGEMALDMERRHARREEGSFSYRNAVVADPGTGVEAALAGCPLREEPEPIAQDLPAMFVPLQDLENLACRTWYVNVLAAYPKHWAQGHGTRLLGIASQFAQAEGRRRLSLNVADTNQAARRFYERAGFRHVASRPMVKEGWQGSGETYLLLIREGRLT